MVISSGHLTAIAALGAGVAVTRHAHRVPASLWWDQRVGRTRLRRSDLPAGGTAALLAAAVLHGVGQRQAARAVAALGFGAAAGALATGFAEPLLPSPSAPSPAPRSHSDPRNESHLQDPSS